MHVLSRTPVGKSIATNSFDIIPGIIADQFELPSALVGFDLGPRVVCPVTDRVLLVLSMRAVVALSFREVTPTSMRRAVVFSIRELTPNEKEC
jgi:hypothetical protein